jgi:hypothetical protein
MSGLRDGMQVLTFRTNVGAMSWRPAPSIRTLCDPR